MSYFGERDIHDMFFEEVRKNAKNEEYVIGKRI
jgi:hypothetical protein